MKSKAEMADAIQICMLTPDCKGCAYHSDTTDGSSKCRREMIEDIINILSKSDFEVLSEIISRNKRFDFECHEGPKGLMWIKLQNPAARDCLPVDIRFDKGGNIL